MPFDVRTVLRTAGDRTGEVVELTNGRVRAEIWPPWGFNCLRWQIRQSDGRWGDLFYSAPDWESNPVPTRSGHPVLFPFPGRLRDGTFSFEGRTFTLPLNDSTKRNAIHGFTPRDCWRLVHIESGADSASATGDFTLETDLPEAAALWPADFKLSLTYRLFTDRLRVESRVDNPGPCPLPCGLGYHPYFRFPDVSDASIGGYVLQANVSEEWKAVDGLPTGRRVPIAAALDFCKPRPIGEAAFDNVLTNVVPQPFAAELVELAALSHPASSGRLRILGDRSFRELVLFTPPHRQAIAIEPYTCAADAANLAARGLDSGWRTLQQNESWEAVVEYRWETA